MISIRINKGWDLNIEGAPLSEVGETRKPEHVAVLPEKIPFIKPRLRVEEGAIVQIGSVLFEDKRNPDIRFLSPGAGKVVQIVFGPRRIIKEIVIQLDDTESVLEFEALSEKELETIPKDRLIAMLMTGGVWQFIRELPFRDIAAPDKVPSVIMVNLDAKEPFQPHPEAYLKGKTDLFEYGIRILRRIAPEVWITASHDSAYVLKELFLKPVNEWITHMIIGNYPADDPGVVRYYTRKSANSGRYGFINGQDVLMLAGVLKTGTYPVERMITVAGNSISQRQHVKTRMGVPIDYLLEGKVLDGRAVRYIAGGLFRGYTTSRHSYMGFYETSLTVIPESGSREFLGFIRPGFNKPSYSRSFLSVFNKSPKKMTAALNGEERACVACSYCADICPVDMLPQLTFKCVLADEIEEALAHGLLDCVECGLCTYVCPSKIEIASILKNAKSAYYNEQIR